MGGFVYRMFELRGGLRSLQAARASSIDAHEGEQRRKQAGGGVFLFGYFSLTPRSLCNSGPLVGTPLAGIDKQNKVPRLVAKRIVDKTNGFLGTSSLNFRDQQISFDSALE